MFKLMLLVVCAAALLAGPAVAKPQVLVDYAAGYYPAYYSAPLTYSYPYAYAYAYPYYY